MIQRIQSVYLLISMICLGLMMKFPFAKFANAITFDSSGLHSVEGGVTLQQIFTFPPYYLIIGLVFMTIIILMLFKNRKLQILLCRLNYLLILGMIVLLYLNIDKIHTGVNGDIEYGIGLYLPVAALAFNFLASRAIRNDEKLVRSLDRLR